MTAWSSYLRGGAVAPPAALPARGLGRIAVGLLLTAAVTAQVTAAPDGWTFRTTFVETSQPWLVRCALHTDARHHLVAVRHQLFHLSGRRTANSRPLLDLGSADDIAFLLDMGNGLVAVGALRSGDVALVDPDLGHVGGFAGVANPFDAVALGADLLVSANPQWPQGGAHTGVWLVGPGRTPREILALVGPSAPLTLRANGDLVVGELGTVVPPQPGAVRLLQIPAAHVAAAVAGATLSMVHVSAIGTGHSGLFDLAVDDLDRLHATDPVSSLVVHTAPGGLTPVGTTIDVGAGRFALTLHYEARGAAPFRGFQPSDAAPALGIGTSDFSTSYGWMQLRSQRPQATATTGTAVPTGPFGIDVTGAPPSGLAIALASLPGPGPEVVVATIDGTPLWLGLPLATTFVVATAPVATSGAATFSLWNPGTVPGRVDLQVVAMDTIGAGAVGSAPVLRLDLQP